jgi:hypothetical protein
MDDFRKSVTYEEGLPTSHEELKGFMDEERPSRDQSLFEDLALRYGSHVGGGMVAGFGLTEGLEHFDVWEALGANDQMALLLGPPLAGAALGSYVGLKNHRDEMRKHRDEVSNWKKAQGLERRGEDFSADLEDRDFVVVRDYLLGDGEPLERTGETASALYREALGLDCVQYFEDVGGMFPDVDYQLSLFEDGEPVRSFYVGEGLVDEGAYSGTEVESLFEDAEGAVSLEDYR